MTSPVTWSENQETSQPSPIRVTKVVSSQYGRTRQLGSVFPPLGKAPINNGMILQSPPSARLASIIAAKQPATMQSNASYNSTSRPTGRPITSSRQSYRIPKDTRRAMESGKRASTAYLYRRRQLSSAKQHNPTLSKDPDSLPIVANSPPKSAEVSSTPTDESSLYSKTLPSARKHVHDCVWLDSTSKMEIRMSFFPHRLQRQISSISSSSQCESNLSHPSSVSQSFDEANQQSSENSFSEIVDLQQPAGQCAVHIPSSVTVSNIYSPLICTSKKLWHTPVPSDS